MALSTKVIYQLYPKSFYDANGDGIGDLSGIISKLDYLKKLGVDMIWLNPIYPSPQKDNGYDVSDYIAVDPIFGSMADFDKLVHEAKYKGIDLMLDMVFNHTSTEHEWFQKALAGDKYFQDFYYLRPAQADGSLPTNWGSKFGGPAWERFGETGLYYLHLFDVSQADLNWHNPNVRQELFKVVNFWLEKGAKGFRFDVLNVIGKSEEMIDSEEPGSSQERSLYTDTAIVHKWIKEMNQATFGNFGDIITVGEMSSTTVENCIRYSNPQEKELHMIFSFHHLTVDYENGEKWSISEFDFIKFKQTFHEWQSGLSKKNGWTGLFLNNYDQPRSNSRFGDVVNYPYETQTMLGQAIQFLRGTPFIYQGEEIGMTNPKFEDINDYNDVETRKNFQIMLNNGKTELEALAILKEKSRDNSRTPMQWDSTRNAGFSTGKPWLKVAANYQSVNVASEIENGKIFKYYQQLIQLRKNYDVIANGSYRSLMLNHLQVMAYVRENESEQLLVLNHFYASPIELEFPAEFHNRQGKVLIGNYSDADFGVNRIRLRPYETIAILFDKLR